LLTTQFVGGHRGETIAKKGRITENLPKPFKGAISHDRYINSDLTKNAGSARAPLQNGTRVQRLKTILFLCTGNYYRSRFAELLFNHLARHNQLDWAATSRALALERGRGNIGPISQDTVDALVEREIPLKEQFRYPIAVEENDLAIAGHIVAVKQDEHLPLLERKFPHWAERVEFWHVHDLDFAMPRQALLQIERNVRGLIRRLKPNLVLRVD
jgi:protein-tyrosine phosphatase